MRSPRSVWAILTSPTKHSEKDRNDCLSQDARRHVMPPYSTRSFAASHDACTAKHRRQQDTTCRLELQCCMCGTGVCVTASGERGRSLAPRERPWADPVYHASGKSTFGTNCWGYRRRQLRHLNRELWLWDAAQIRNPKSSIRNQDGPLGEQRHSPFRFNVRLYLQDFVRVS